MITCAVSNFSAPIYLRAYLLAFKVCNDVKVLQPICDHSGMNIASHIVPKLPLRERLVWPN